MKTRFPIAPILFLLSLLCAALRLMAVPGDHLRETTFIDRQGGVPVRIAKASVWYQATENILIGTNFTMTVYRAKPAGTPSYSSLSNQAQLYVLAPVCEYDLGSHAAWNDEGHIILYTPTTNVFVQGDGFYFTQTNQLLSIFHNVETRVLKALLRSPLLNGPASNAVPASPQVMKIFSGAAQFDYPSDRVDYQRHVHLIDPQMDMTSAFLTVHLNTNGTLESALARREVVLTTTNKGVATGERGYYYVTNGDEMMELTDHAHWKNGDEDAEAESFLYDSNLHFLTGSKQVRVRWPNPAPGANRPPPGALPVAGTNGFRKLSADFVTMQMPVTNGPVERMTATGHVVMTNEADHSNSSSAYAVYARTNDSFELTGQPVWWNEKMEVKGNLLRAELTNQLYQARGNAQFKLNLTAARTNANTIASTAATHRWLKILSDDLDYRTNLATFHGHVTGRLFENEALKDTLTCDELVVTLESNHIVQAVATGEVRGQSEPNLAGVTKTISCATLTAYCWPATNLLKDLVAETNVTLLNFSNGAKGATNRLTADGVTAHFAAVTNQLETALAERHVVLDQWKGAQTAHVTGEKAFYMAANDRATVTGSPYARTQSYIITESDLLVMHPKTNRFQALGHYTITPIKPNTNQPPS